ncbi:dihydrolipoamide acetyltransferase component of pyruvate dehydrogenase complex [Marivirga tractuosa]|uniref:Dihydrolipoamide acetyltransferase component of pyruvate dehydrogenase complex n=1 Tax=Marivirga tractuosa (strain ATCC 23168 / DSM 4126 / NBRC 15989 / NCIMB 1408 / VKM B-1430 / H-43) TaxID=643867 RepID=E4TPX1_MARTH|nr:dihydrolipoamide acetyltransferase family protein [Marivirga tractuosa]ADR20528.1 catalytic domain-containing protein of components of various dehydrogenase complexes [Marivirga tractuosa DSM 4126]BDD15024.1 dihydrolipoamide acetyltransferase component of pyruvate dehydrogenase complex [Marivirga tractuosa]
MATVEMVMPKMGESIMEATVLTWLKKEGDTIEEDESVLEVATDKVDTEVPALEAGVLKQILVQEGDVVAVGKPIAIIETEGGASADSDNTGEKSEKQQSPAPATATAETSLSSSAGNNGHDIAARSESGRFYSPLVRNIAKEENIAMDELEGISGTGKDGRVTKKDILSYLDNRGSAPVQAPSQPSSAQAAPSPQPAAQPAPQGVPVSISGDDEIIEMDRMRKMIAGRMVDSKRISPHVTSFVEADMTSVVQWRNKHKNTFKEQENGNLTFTPIFIEAVVKAIKDYPMINVQVDGDRIIKKKHINIGMAVALPSGNLIVPVIKDADQLNIRGLANKVNDLARRARDGKLKAEELEGGTFTISNVGSFGNVMGTPIIMQPQVGILALGAIVKKPAVLETPQGDVIAIRHKMFLSHSYDHRVVDGSLGGMVVRRVADYLEKWDVKKDL